MDYPQALPDELWLLVFKLLPLEALLEARGVCRRWRRLALDPSVWEHHVLECPFLDGTMNARKVQFARLALRALRVAPRLRSLAVSDVTPPAYRKAAIGTGCAVAKLRLMFTRDSSGGDADPSGPEHALEQVLRRQLHLGAGLLREVVLCVDPARAAPVLELALRAELRELEVFVNHCRPCNSTLSDAAARGNAALKVLRCGGSGLPLLMQPLLRAHASTLQTLVAREGWFGGDGGLLASCLQLRRLELDVRDDNAGVLAAAASAHITELILHGVTDRFSVDWMAFVPSVRSLPHLRRLELPSARGSLSAVAGHESAPSLEELRLGYDEDLSWDGVLDALAGLPQLRSLSVFRFERGSDQPGRVAAAHLPSLQELRLGHTCVSFAGIPRCGLPALHGLVRRNPRLHVLGIRAAHSCPTPRAPAEGTRRECDCCQRSLHLPGLEAHSHYSLCGHGEGEQCDLPALHAQPGKCPCTPNCKRPHTWQHVS